MALWTRWFYAGCRKGIGKGNFLNGAGSGAGHGGKGGSGMFNGSLSEGGGIYGNANLPCELGSGSEGLNESYGHVAGGGMIGKYISINKNILLTLLQNVPKRPL